VGAGRRGDAQGAPSVSRGVRRFPVRLLVDLPNWVGDFVHALPAVQGLLAANRGGRTCLLVPEGHAEIARATGAEVLARPPRAGLRWARATLSGQFDVALSARHSLRAKLLLAGCAAPVRLASRGRGAALVGLHTFPVDRARHQRHDLDGALRSLGLPAIHAVPVRLPLSRRLRREGQELRRSVAGPGAVVALLPGSHGMAEKRYPSERWAAVARELVQRGARTVIVPGPGEEELGSLIAWAGGARLAPAVWPLAVVAAFLAACDGAAGNDSGLTHLAAVVGCPTVAVFGPTDPERTAPVGGATIVRGHGAGDPLVVWPRPATVAAALLAAVGGARTTREERRWRPAVASDQAVSLHGDPGTSRIRVGVGR